MFAVVVKNTPLYSADGLEMVLLPGSVVEKRGDGVVTKEYPSVKQLYIKDALEWSSTKPPERKRVLPTKTEMLRRLHAIPALPYLWGGNVLDDPYGIDCSGLVYYMTDGCTPRNSTDLCGLREVPVEEREPLDLVVWPGHVMIVLSKDEMIESRGGFGVVRTSFQKRWEEVLTHQPKVVRIQS